MLSLPRDVLQHICAMLSWRDVLALRSTCRTAMRVLSMPLLLSRCFARGKWKVFDSDRCTLHSRPSLLVNFDSRLAVLAAVDEGGCGSCNWTDWNVLAGPIFAEESDKWLFVPSLCYSSCRSGGIMFGSATRYKLGSSAGYRGVFYDKFSYRKHQPREKLKTIMLVLKNGSFRVESGRECGIYEDEQFRARAVMYSDRDIVPAWFPVTLDWFSFAISMKHADAFL